MTSRSCLPTDRSRHETGDSGAAKAQPLDVRAGHRRAQCRGTSKVSRAQVAPRVYEKTRFHGMQHSATASAAAAVT